MWHYDKKELVGGPLSIGSLNIGTSNIDAAVQWFVSDKVYIFIKLFTYWRINENKYIEGVSAITAGWPGILESALFPDCACDCTDSPNRVYWEFQKMDFEVEHGYTKLLQKLEVIKHVNDIRNGNPDVQKEFKVFKNIARTESFNHVTGIKLASGTKFKIAVLYSINEKIPLTDGDPHGLVYGVKNRVSNTIMQVFNFRYLIDMETTCTVTEHMAELSVL